MKKKHAFKIGDRVQFKSRKDETRTVTSINEYPDGDVWYRLDHMYAYRENVLVLEGDTHERS